MAINAFEPINYFDALLHLLINTIKMSKNHATILLTVYLATSCEILLILLARLKSSMR